MSDGSSKLRRKDPPRRSRDVWSRILHTRYKTVIAVLGFPVWVGVSFFGAQFIVAGSISLLQKLAILPPLDVKSSIVNALFAAVVYLVTFVIVAGIPYVIYRVSTNRTLLGLERQLSWMDILMSFAGAIVYLFLSGVLLMVVTSLVQGFDIDQVQDVGFSSVATSSQYLLAFVTLIVVAPIAEEVLFRGYLYGNIRRHAPVWLSILATSVLFGAAHMQWNVGIDTFALSIVLCGLREVTGSIWAGILLHMLKNSLAFYLLFLSH